MYFIFLSKALMAAFLPDDNLARVEDKLRLPPGKLCFLTEVKQVLKTESTVEKNCIRLKSY